MKLSDLQPYDSLTFRNNRVYHHYENSKWNTHNEDFTSKKNRLWDIVKVTRNGIILYEDAEYRRLHNNEM